MRGEFDNEECSAASGDFNAFKGSAARRMGGWHSFGRVNYSEHRARRCTVDLCRRTRNYFGTACGLREATSFRYL
jgi:hypothetical protein